MSGTSITYERLEDRPLQYAEVYLSKEPGSVAEDREYSICLTGFIGGLSLSNNGGQDDAYLITDCIENDALDQIPDSAANVCIVLRESGEWEGFSWHKYFEVSRITVME